MNATVPQASAPTTPAAPTPTSAWMIEVFRLTRWELYLAWRRAMAKVLIILLVVFYAITIGFLCFVTAQIINQPIGVTQCPPEAVGCYEPSQQEIQQEREAQIAPLTDQLTFPTSLGFAASFTRIVGLILICILAGTLVGSEYGYSTQRLAFSRGTSRLQILVAQGLALAVISMIVAAGMLILGALVGFIAGPAFGVAVSAPSFGGWMEILKFFVAFAFSLFAYTIMALGAATLGKSTAAGIGLSLGYIVLEFIMGTVLFGIGTILSAAGNKDTGQMLLHIPDWFLGNNVGALMGHAGQYPIGLAADPGPDMTFARTLIVSLIYCAVFFGGSFLLLSRRDVTE